MKKFLHALDSDKIKINWNKNLIRMDLFLSFLTIPTTRCNGHLGEENGWTKHKGDGGLVVSGGIFKGVEYLDRLEYGYRLDNPYNNYVNPFYLFDVMSKDGKEFFINYYKPDIAKVISEAEDKAEAATNNRDAILAFWEPILRPVGGVS